MPRSSPRTAVVVLLAVLAVGGMGLVNVAAFSPHAGGPSTVPGAAASSSLAHAHPHLDPRGAPGAGPRATHRGTHDRPPTTPAARAGHPMLFPPNPARFSAAPGAAAASSVFATTPAPMGLSDLGVGASGSYEYGTASFEGSLTATSFSAFTPTNTTNLSYPSPDWALLQLDAVAVNVTLPPALSTASNGTFWVQNGLHFNGSTVQLQDNIWNFSSKSSNLPPSTLQGLHGSILYDEVYSGIGPTFTVTLPVTIELFDNITTLGSHTVVRFGYSIAGHGGDYDVVTFNGSSSATSTSQFLVDGSALNPAKLLYDAEFDLGGNGNGANANLVALNGTATLSRFTGTAYVPVPSAFDFGADASETALGVAVAYTGTTARLTAGPSFLAGLWNTTGTNASRLAPHASPGWIEVQISVTPSYALLFATNNSSASGPLASANFSYAPTNLAGDLTTDLPPPPGSEPYVFSGWADGYAQINFTIGDNSTNLTPATLHMTPSPATFDAPVYLRGTAQAVAFGQAGIDHTSYAPALQTVWLNASQDALAAPFLRTNEYNVPTFTLLAAVRVNASFVANGFVQAPSTYNYTNEAGTVIRLSNWTQGYFFYYGSGHFTVANTTIEGNTSLIYGAYPTYPPSTIEFYHTSGDSVSNLSAIEDGIGVTVDASSSTRVTNLGVGTGALGLLAVDASGVTISHASASGEDRAYIPSTLANLTSSTSVTASNLSVADLAYGLDLEHVSGLTVVGLTVTSDALGLLANDTNSATVSGLTVGGGGISTAGSWADSTGLTFTSVAVNGTGLNLSHDTTVSVTGGSALGYGSAVVSNFTGSSHGTFRQLTAYAGADALNLVNCTIVNASQITAINGSVGVFLANSTAASGSGYVSTNLSVGLLANHTTTGTFSAFTTSDQSIGAFLSNNSSGIRISSVVASNATLNPFPFDYFQNASALVYYPTAGVGFVNAQSITVTGVTATDYPFAVWSNNSTHVNISQVVARYGYQAVALNFTNSSQVTEVFAFAEFNGVSLQNSSGTTVATSTLEISGGFGFELVNGSKDIVEQNNFVGNNGSSVIGTFNASHDQAYWNNTSSPTFKDNYWSDRSGAAYSIYNSTGQAVKDLAPLPGFSSTYLEFTERGLPLGWNWTIVLAGTGYTTNVSVLYVPGWAIANGSLAFTVAPILDYPAHPSSGSLTWSAVSKTQTIVFGATSSPAPSLPLWLIAAVVGGAAVVVAAVLLLRRRRPPAQATYVPGAPTGPEWPPGVQR